MGVLAGFLATFGLFALLRRRFDSEQRDVDGYVALVFDQVPDLGLLAFLDVREFYLFIGLNELGFLPDLEDEPLTLVFGTGPHDELFIFGVYAADATERYFELRRLAFLLGGLTGLLRLSTRAILRSPVPCLIFTTTTRKEGRKQEERHEQVRC